LNVLKQALAKLQKDVDALKAADANGVKQTLGQAQKDGRCAEGRPMGASSGRSPC